jgi:superfamily II RNA helicase
MENYSIDEKELGFGFKLDDFQLEAINHINTNKSVVVCAPTGAGKTVIAEFAVKKALQNNKRVFYTTPLKALSNQKFNDFKTAYGEEKTGLLTGDISINRDAQIVVMTTEVYRNMLYGTNLGKVEENLKNVQYVVLDEVHYMNDEQRGTVWEESIIYSPNNIQIIALSATIANASELTDWINTVHGETHLVNTDFRPVPLRHFYFSKQNPDKIYPLFAPGGKLNSKIKPEKPTFRGGKKTKETSPMDLVQVLHSNDMLPAIYFTFSRKKCDDNMADCSKLKLLNDFEERRLLQIIDEHVLDMPYLAKSKYLEYLYAGVASHHAGLLPGWKVLVEKLFKQGLIKVVFATETLAAGINMPARSTVISSISKRTDEGHRILTASEFLQMSGRAGRRGMDEVGYVTIVGTSFQSPEEVAELASSTSDPLGSKFTPSYSMVLNLLQRFKIEEARELILKSFGYFSSNERLKPLFSEQNKLKDIIEDINSLRCPYNLTDKDVIEYNKLKNTYIQYRKLTNTLRKQAKNAGRKFSPEVAEYEAKTKDFQRRMEKSKCNFCKHYKKHIKNLEVLDRFNKRYKRINEVIEFEKDIYWRQFTNLMNVLIDMGHLIDGYPTNKGFTTASVRSENELFFTELIMSGILDDLSPSELAAVVCAVATEEPKAGLYNKFQLSGMAKKTIADARETLRKVWKAQKNHNVDTLILLNPQMSPYIEFWTQGGEWDELVKGLDIGEGDLVRIFKRSIDLLRQLTVIPNVPNRLAKTASIAIECINRDPISEIF